MPQHAHKRRNAYASGNKDSGSSSFTMQSQGTERAIDFNRCAGAQTLQLALVNRIAHPCGYTQLILKWRSDQGESVTLAVGVGILRVGQNQVSGRPGLEGKVCRPGEEKCRRAEIGSASWRGRGCR